MFILPMVLLTWAFVVTAGLTGLAIRSLFVDHDEFALRLFVSGGCLAALLVVLSQIAVLITS